MDGPNSFQKSNLYISILYLLLKWELCYKLASLVMFSCSFDAKNIPLIVLGNFPPGMIAPHIRALIWPHGIEYSISNQCNAVRQPNRPTIPLDPWVVLRKKNENFQKLTTCSFSCPSFRASPILISVLSVHQGLKTFYFSFFLDFGQKGKLLLLAEAWDKNSRMYCCLQTTITTKILHLIVH